jgi:asparagine synthase (glutamine-hydrolysing)
MSGIYGIFRYDGAPVDPRWLQRMKEAMAYYGPDGDSCQIEGPVGLGHLLLEVNPEDLFENQPVRGERGIVVSTARLDNRDALLEMFNIPASEAPHLSDGHLVSLAFDRWGEEVFSHLEGDWTLAAWDPRKQRLFLALDALGIGALYYYEGKGFIAFASSLKALLALPGTVKEPDWLRLAEVLACWQNDAELTAYKGFRRLLWAHAMTIGGDGQTRVWRHWSPEGRIWLNYRRDEEYVEAFLEHCTRAVGNCLRTRKPVAAELSGGRDSGSIVALAAAILAGQGRNLTAFTSVPSQPADGASPARLGNEWDLAHETATMAGANVKHVPIDARDYGVIGGIEHFLDIHDGPSHGAVNQYWCQAILEAVSESGSRVLLCGGMGNATISWAGHGSAALALLQGYPAAAFRLLLHAEPNPWLTVRRQILKPLLMPGRRAIRLLKLPPISPWRSYSALNPEMARELDMEGRMRAAGHDLTFTTSPLTDVHSLFYGPTFGVAVGISSEIGAMHSLSYRFPAINLALTEFLLRVPDDQFRRAGKDCWLYRRAFQNRVPQPVLHERQKGLQGADLGHRILRELPKFRESLDSLDALPEARAILDLPLLRSSLDDLVAKVDPDTTARAGSRLLLGLGVGIFLRRLADSGSRGSCLPC